MSKQILVKTQYGNGGHMCIEGRWGAGPRNLLAAVKMAGEIIRETRGIGGYRTWIEIDGKVLSNWERSWPTTMNEARMILAEPRRP